MSTRTILDILSEKVTGDEKMLLPLLPLLPPHENPCGCKAGPVTAKVTVKPSAVTATLHSSFEGSRGQAAPTPGAAPAPQPAPGRLPCDRTPGLPCLGSEGTCFSRPYWDLKTFDDKNIRRKAAGLAECPSAERVERYISEHRDQIVAGRKK